MRSWNNIILVGFMGSGKSTVGKRLAKVLEWDFIDTDWQIEEITGLSVADIFRRHGETRFRSEEELVIQRLADQTRTVIATGGGTLINPKNLERLRELGLIIGLYAPLEIILKRIGNRTDRPLLKGSLEELERLWHERQKLYEQADYTIDTTEKDVEGVVGEILTLIRREENGMVSVAEN